MTPSCSHAHPYHVRGMHGRHLDVLSGRHAGHQGARLRLCYADSPSPARRTGFNACASASLGLRTPLRLLPTPPRGGAVAFRFSLFPHHHRAWTFTSYRHDLGLARSRGLQPPETNVLGESRRGATPDSLIASGFQASLRDAGRLHPQPWAEAHGYRRSSLRDGAASLGRLPATCRRASVLAPRRNAKVPVRPSSPDRQPAPVPSSLLGTSRIAHCPRLPP
jgi:hypothetical protein